MARRSTAPHTTDGGNEVIGDIEETLASIKGIQSWHADQQRHTPRTVATNCSRAITTIVKTFGRYKNNAACFKPIVTHRSTSSRTMDGGNEEIGGIEKCITQVTLNSSDDRSHHSTNESTRHGYAAVEVAGRRIAGLNHPSTYASSQSIKTHPNQDEMSKGKAKVAFKAIYRPKSQGALGLKELGVWNKVVITKHLWHVVVDKNILRVKWIYTIKLKDRSVWAVEEDINDSWGGGIF
ncbi:hypothetical protein Tco_0520382 [Tanacetum coccineum]